MLHFHARGSPRLMAKLPWPLCILCAKLNSPSPFRLWQESFFSPLPSLCALPKRENPHKYTRSWTHAHKWARAQPSCLCFPNPICSCQYWSDGWLFIIMPWRQIERFPCRCHAFVCAATFALDLIKSKQTHTHSYMPHTHSEWCNWQKITWIRERQRTWKSGKGRERAWKWGGQRPWAPTDDFLLFFTPQTKAPDWCSCVAYQPKMSLLYYCAFKIAYKVKCNSTRKLTQQSCRFCFSGVCFDQQRVLLVKVALSH